MDILSRGHRLSRRAPAWAVALAGLACLAAAHQAGSWLQAQTATRGVDWALLAKEREKSTVSAAELQTLRDLRARDVARLKQGLTGLTNSRLSLYEAGLSLQEEKRLLEKQWEIMSTYLLIDPGEQKIRLMRGDQALQSFSVAFTSAAFGGITKPLPATLQIVSKERFAHPERGVSEQVGGQLRYAPPQVGTSVRANALGQYVMFFTGGFILHGPATLRADHEAFPHYCAGLSLSAARKLYKESFIGTRLVFKKDETGAREIETGRLIHAIRSPGRSQPLRRGKRAKRHQ